MRKDMYKVIVERPRWDSRISGRNRQADDIEESPRQEALSKYQRSKWLNENLRPLQRYLSSQTGRPWRKVYSEICTSIDRRNTVQQHIHEHLADFVAMKVVLIDGVQCYEHRWRGIEPLERYWAPMLYVDPKSGLLRSNRLREKARRHYRDERLRKAAALQLDRRELDATHQLHRVDGIWYRVELAPIACAGESNRAAYDVLRRVEVNKCPGHQNKKGIISNLNLFGNADVYARNKRQLNARELREHQLSNNGGSDDANHPRIRKTRSLQ